MNTSKLVANIAERQNLSKAETRRLLDAVVETLTVKLSQGKSFTIPELGTFDVEIKDEQRAYSPHYEHYMKLPPKRKVHYYPAKGLKETFK